MKKQPAAEFEAQRAVAADIAGRHTAEQAAWLRDSWRACTGASNLETEVISGTYLCACIALPLHGLVQIQRRSSKFCQPTNSACMRVPNTVCLSPTGMNVGQDGHQHSLVKRVVFNCRGSCRSAAGGGHIRGAVEAGSGQLCSAAGWTGAPCRQSSCFAGLLCCHGRSWPHQNAAWSQQGVPAWSSGAGIFEMNRKCENRISDLASSGWRVLTSLGGIAEKWEAVKLSMAACKRLPRV